MYAELFKASQRLTAREKFRIEYAKVLNKLILRYDETLKNVQLNSQLHDEYCALIDLWVTSNLRDHFDRKVLEHFFKSFAQEAHTYG